jgi:hypothetical protein
MLTDTATQLYPVDRLANISTARLNRIHAFATIDAETTWVIYDGMTRDGTRATARRTQHDVMAELHLRAEHDDMRRSKGLPPTAGQLFDDYAEPVHPA